jgi:hypothetical protein
VSGGTTIRKEYGSHKVRRRIRFDWIYDRQSNNTIELTTRAVGAVVKACAEAMRQKMTAVFIMRWYWFYLTYQVIVMLSFAICDYYFNENTMKLEKIHIALYLSILLESNPFEI